MAIKNHPEFKTVSVYDPSAGAFREITLEDYEKQLKSLGLTDNEIKQKIDKAIEPHKIKLAESGLSEKEINKIFN